MIDPSTIDRIYASASIVDIVSDFVSLKKKGTNYQACCPFHNEKTPSFVVSPAKGLFKCFGCGKAGNAVTFVMEHEHIGYVDALKYVAKRYGIEIEETRPSPEQELRQNQRQSMLTLNAYAQEYFKNELHNTPDGKAVALSYVRERGISDAMIERFGLGYCGQSHDAFTRKALAEGYQEEFLVATGLTIKRETGGYYDRFCDRVIFPIYNISGGVVGFGGRTMKSDKKMAKYLNSPESEIYHKSDLLYGLYQSKSAITKNDACILVEGYTDVISMHQSGVENVVASSGTSLTQGQIALIARFTKNVTVIYDGDAAGIKASLRGIDMILAAGLNVRVVPLPAGEDPDSFARSHSAAQLTEYLEGNKENFLAFKVATLLKDSGNDPIERANVIKDIAVSISVIPDHVSRSVYVQECAGMLDVDVNVLEREVSNLRQDSQLKGEEREQMRDYRHNQAQKQAFLEQKEQTAKQHGGKQKSIHGGSSIDELEMELIGYLLKWGHCYIDHWSGGQKERRNVAASIIEEIEGDNITLENPVLNKIFIIYVQSYNDVIGDFMEKGEECEWRFPLHTLINSNDPDMSRMVSSIVMENINYKVSQLWKQFDILVPDEEERLISAVPRAILIYKTKVIENIISELNKELISSDLSEDRVCELMNQINILNTMRKSVCEKFSRIIL